MFFKVVEQVLWYLLLLQLPMQGESADDFDAPDGDELTPAWTWVALLF